MKMRAVVETEPGTLELNYMWLPTFIGMSHVMKGLIEKALASDLVGKPMTEELLDWAHDRVLDIIQEKFPIPGLRDYLDSMKFVTQP